MKIKMLMPSLLLILCLVTGLAAPLQAATGYEVSGVTFSQTVTASQYVQVTANLTVSWTKPTDAAKVMNYFMKFNTSSVALTDTQLYDDSSQTHTYDYKVGKDFDNQTIVTSFFDSYDSNQIRYLHIKTQYVTTADPFYAYSDDVVVGPIRIDNTAPTGTITLDPTSSSSTQVNVTISAASETKYFWLNDAATFPGGTGSDYSLFQAGVVNLRSGTSYGKVTIYAWFEDAAGNRSTAASATADYTYTAPVSIRYTDADNKIAVGDSLIFDVDGSTPYNWTLTPSVTGVAEITGGDTATTKNNATSITVKGLAVGTFTLSAVPTAGGTTLNTSTITVVQSYTRGDCNADSSIDSGDAILVLRYSVGLITLTETQKAAGNVTGKTSNNDIDSGDAIKILRYSVGLITSF